MGLLFIFDRVTGKPVFGMEERPVPQTDRPRGVDVEDAAVPDQAAAAVAHDLRSRRRTSTRSRRSTPTWCKNLWEQNQLFAAGPYAPMPLGRRRRDVPQHARRRRLWRRLLQPAARAGVRQRVEPRHGRAHGAADGSRNRRGHLREELGRLGGPYGRFWNPDNRIPCSAPPFGELVAVNVNTGDIAWRVPLGIVEELEAKGIKNTGALNLGGSMATASGLVFIGATADKRFRAFDAKTGKELWVTEIDADAKAAPMTFLGRDGRQYVVIMAGGGQQLSKTTPASGGNLIAFALPAVGKKQ